MECLVLYTGVTPPRDDTDHYCCIAAAGLGVVRDDFWHEDWNQMITTLRYPRQNSGRQIHLKINSVVNNHSTGWVLRLGSK